MEPDFLKRYVEQHKDAFESDALPPNMLGNILGNLKEREKRKAKKVRKLTYTGLAVACSLLMAVGAYLFVSQGTDEIQQDHSKVAANKIKPVALPTISKVEEPIIEKKASAIKPPIRQFAAHQPKANPYKEIYDGLKDSLSVASRLEAIIKVNGMASLSEKLKIELCKTFDKDGNDNVRLAALEVLSKFSNDIYIHEQLVAGLGKQKDPVVQLELVKIMGSNSNPETTNKLIAMANNPFTVNAVKEQVYYALLTNDN